MGRMGGWLVMSFFLVGLGVECVSVEILGERLAAWWGFVYVASK